MTGQEHFEEAERLLEIADEVGVRVGPDSMQAYAAQAQVHATLALAVYARDYLPGRLS